MSMPIDKAAYLASGKCERSWYGLKGKRAQHRLLRPLVYINGMPHTYEQIHAMTGLPMEVIAERDQKARKDGIKNVGAYVTRPYRTRYKG